MTEPTPASSSASSSARQKAMAELAEKMNRPVSAEVSETLLELAVTDLEVEALVAQHPNDPRDLVLRGLYRDADGVLRTTYRAG